MLAGAGAALDGPSGGGNGDDGGGFGGSRGANDSACKHLRTSARDPQDARSLQGCFVSVLVMISGVVPQPAEPAAKTRGVAGTGQAGGGKRCEVRRGAVIGCAAASTNFTMIPPNSPSGSW